MPLRRILPLAGPIFLQSVMGFSANLVSLMFVGHLGSLQLSQAVLGLAAYNVTGLSVLLGLSMGYGAATWHIDICGRTSCAPLTLIKAAGWRLVQRRYGHTDPAPNMPASRLLPILHVVGSRSRHQAPDREICDLCSPACALCPHLQLLCRHLEQGTSSTWACFCSVPYSCARLAWCAQ